MQLFAFEKTAIADLVLIKPFIAADDRGYLLKSFESQIFAEHDIHLQPYEEVTTVSSKGVLRGMHFQRQFSQDKLIRILNGALYDVAVDLRKNSPTFGKWAGFYLTAENHHELYIPKGFAHGFLALQNQTVINYLLGDKYHKESEDGIVWNDPELNIAWPLHEVEQVIVSDKDQRHPTLADFKAKWGGF